MNAAFNRKGESMERKKLLFIYNPLAGKTILKNKLSAVIELFMKQGFSVNIYATRYSGEAIEIVKEVGDQFDRIVCAGGDGTLHETMVGLMSFPKHKRCPCGFIPTGTVNDFANGIGIPKRIAPAAEVAGAGIEIPYDIGSMNDRYFNYIAAFGAFTAVSYETPQATKNILGRIAYFLDALTKLPQIKPYHMIVRVDGEHAAEDDFVLGMVTNAMSVGGFPLFKKSKVSLNDGLFEGIFVRNPKNPIELSAAVTALMGAKENEQIVLLRGKQFEIIGDEKTPYTVDGENGGEHKKVLIDNEHEAVTYIKSPEKMKNKRKSTSISKKD